MVDKRPCPIFEALSVGKNIRFAFFFFYKIPTFLRKGAVWSLKTRCGRPQQGFPLANTWCY